MDPQAIRELFDYSYWAFDLIWPAIEELSDEEFITDLGYSFGSVRNQVVHLISSHWRWLQRLQGTQPAAHLEFGDFLTISSVKAEWEGARSEMLGYVNTLDRGALAEAVSYQLPARQVDTSNRRWQILTQMVNHSTDHRSQLLAMLNMHFGIETPEQDYIIYLWKKGAGG